MFYMNSKFEMFNLEKYAYIAMEGSQLIIKSPDATGMVVEDFNEVGLPQNSVRLFLTSFFKLMQANVHFSFNAVNEYSRGLLVANVKKEMEPEIIRQALYNSDIFELKR